MCFYAKCWSTGKRHAHRHTHTQMVISFHRIVTCSHRQHWMIHAFIILSMDGRMLSGGRVTNCLEMIEWTLKEESNLEKQSFVRFFFLFFIPLESYHHLHHVACVPMAWITTKATSFVILLSRHFNSISYCISKRIHTIQHEMSHPCHMLRSVNSTYIWAIPLHGSHLILSCFTRFSFSLSLSLLSFQFRRMFSHLFFPYLAS